MSYYQFRKESYGVKLVNFLRFFDESGNEILERLRKEAQALDQWFERKCTNPDFHIILNLGKFEIHICGTEAIKKSPSGWQCIYGDRSKGSFVDQIWILGGPLGEDLEKVDYISQFGFGHEFIHFISDLLGYEDTTWVDKMLNNY